MSSARLISLLGTIFVAGCAVGPDFITPAAPTVPRYTEGDMPDKTASAKAPLGASQHFAFDKEVPGNWWTLFNSEPLNLLVAKALKANPDLKAAEGSLRQARENYLAVRGELLPSIDANPSITREKFNPSAFGGVGLPASIFTLYNASVSVSYGFDFFGGTRRAVEAAKAQAEAQRYLYEAAYLTLTANVVTAAIQEASLREQVKETQDIIAIEGKQLEVLKKQFELGATPKSIVLEQEAVLAQTQTSLPSLQKQWAQVRHQLATLAGVLPGNAGSETFSLAGLTLPKELPVTLPSRLVEQRPDVKAASEQLHAASAEIGVATANMLPQITLSASYAFESTKFSNLFSQASTAWSAGSGLLQPLFHGGTLLHERRAAVAAYDTLAARYQSTVLTAFRNVADSLRALQFDADALAAQTHAAEAAKGSLDLTQSQFKEGAITYPQLLDAERTYAQTRIGLVEAQAARLADTAALFQALGGGWQTAAAGNPAAAATKPVARVPAATPVTPAPQPVIPATTPPTQSEKKP